MAYTYPMTPVTAVTTTGAALSLTVGASVLSGDVLYAFVSTHATTDTTSTPAGWTKVGSSSPASQSTNVVLFLRVATGTDAGTAYSFTPGTNGASALLSAVRGVDTTNLPGTVDGSAATNGTVTPVLPSVSPTGAADLYLAGISLNATGNTLTSSTTTEETGSPVDNLGSQNAKIELGVFHKELTASGATGTFALTTTSVNWAAFAVCLPAAPGGPIWYVDSAATGANNGTSWTDAWNELNQIVWASIQPGHTIKISGGSTRPTSPFHASTTTPFDFTATKPGQSGGGGKLYQTTLAAGKSGTATAPITIQLAPDIGHNGAVCIYGGRLTSLPYATQATYTFFSIANGARANGIIVGAFNYLVFDGLHRGGIVVYGCDQAGINCSDTTSHNNTFRNFEVFDCGTATTAGGTSDNGNTVAPPNKSYSGGPGPAVTNGVWPGGYWTDWPGIHLRGTAHTIDRCLIHDNGEDEIQQNAGSLKNHIISNTWLYCSRQSPVYPGFGFNTGYGELGAHSDGLQIFTATPDGPFLFDHCLVGPYLLHGLLMGDDIGPTVTLSVVYNHVTVLANTNAISTGGGTAARNWLLQNCTIYFYSGDSGDLFQCGGIDSLAGNGHRFVDCLVAATVAGTLGGVYISVTGTSANNSGNQATNVDFSGSTGGVAPAGWVTNVPPGFTTPLTTVNPSLTDWLGVNLTPTNAAAVGKGSSIHKPQDILDLIDQLDEAPSAVDCTAGNGQVTVRWQAPGFTRAAITSYTVTASPGGATATTPDGSTLSAVVTGLTNGVAYTFTVHATSSAGTTLESPVSGPSTPFARVGGQGLGGGYGGRAWGGADPTTPPGYVWGFVGTPGGEWNRWQMLGGYEPSLTAHAPNPPIPLLTAAVPGTNTATGIAVRQARTATALATFVKPAYTAAGIAARLSRTAVAAATFAPGTKTAAGVTARHARTVTAAATFAPGTKTAAGTTTRHSRTVIATATFAPGTKTATGAATRHSRSVAASATFAPGTKTATGVTTRHSRTVAASATFAPGTKTATGTATRSARTVAATATVAPGTKTATGAAARHARTVTAAATFAPGTKTAVGTAARQARTVSATATFAPGTKTAAGVTARQSRTVAATATFTKPTYAATGTTTRQGRTATATATFTPAGAVTATGVATRSTRTATATATFAPGAKTATGATSRHTRSVSATATFVAPVYTASALTARTARTVSATGTSLPPGAVTGTGTTTRHSRVAVAVAMFSAGTRTTTGQTTRHSRVAAGSVTVTAPTSTATGAARLLSITVAATALVVPPIYTASGNAARHARVAAGTVTVSAPATRTASGLAQRSPRVVLATAATGVLPTGVQAPFSVTLYQWDLRASIYDAALEVVIG